MNTVYDVSTKDNGKISYCSFIQTTLLNLGLSPSSKGTYYLRDIILLAIQEDNFEDINLKHLQNKLAKNKNILPSTIKTNIDYSFRIKNTSKAKDNFETIFNIKYDEYYLTAKTLTNLIYSLIYMQINS